MIKHKQYIFLLLILASSTACSESTNRYSGEANHLNGLSKQELAARVIDLEDLLRKHRRLLKLKNEQIEDLKKDLAEKPKG